ncbi:MAG: hypothetical protein WD042_16305 [Phycisphaeraceae bacterium]
MDTWRFLPWWIRYPLALGMMAIAVLLFLFANPMPALLVGGLFAVGLILLFIGPTDADKKGYRF